jgi:hypothetical protein
MECVIMESSNLVSMVREQAARKGALWGWDHLSKFSDEQVKAAIGSSATRKGAISRAWQVLVKGHYEMVSGKRATVVDTLSVADIADSSILN